jgi:Asp/Glu/hydantoin racemase
MSTGRLLLINPNSSVATTEMMVAIAQETAGERFTVVGATATRAPLLIADPDALTKAAIEVVEIAVTNQSSYDGVIVAAFGDPGLCTVRASIVVPAVGIAEAAMIEAAEGGRRFGIATTTAALVTQISARADDLGLSQQYTGIRVTQGDLASLMADPVLLRSALKRVVEECIARDGAEAVIIGGGPLSQAAMALQSEFSVPIIAPIAAATRRVIRVIGSHLLRATGRPKTDL